MQVNATQIRKSINAKYVLWDGEMVVRVMQHTGVHGFHSVAMVVERMDAPMEVFTESWYGTDYRDAGKPVEPMMQWIANKLTELSTGTLANLGGVGDVEGLLKAV